MALLNKHRQTRLTILPKVGTVALGEKVTNDQGKTYPKSSGFFVIKTTDQFWQQVILQCYGDKPTQLYISLPSKNLGDMVHHVYRLRSKDGQTIAETDDQTLWRFTDQGFVPSSPDEIEKFGGIEKAKEALQKAYDGSTWKEFLMFQFMLLPVTYDRDNNTFDNPFANQPMPLGTFVIYTYGRETIQNITNTLSVGFGNYFCLTYEMKKNKKGVFPVINMVPIIVGNIGQELTNAGAAQLGYQGETRQLPEPEVDDGDGAGMNF